MSTKHRRDPECVPDYAATGVFTMSDADKEEQARQAELAETPDRWIVSAMVQFGGGFVRRLGMAGLAADPDNLRRLKAAWPSYWKEYAESGHKLWKEDSK